MYIQFQGKLFGLALKSRTVIFMLRFLASMAITLIMALTPTQATGKEIGNFNELKGDYLITYLYNKNSEPVDLHNLHIVNYAHKNRYFQTRYEDYVTPQYQPIQSYEYNKITSKSLDKELEFFYNLYNSKPDFGKYPDGDSETVYTIEGRYKGKSFRINMQNHTNFYKIEGVSSDQVILRKEFIGRAYKLHDENIAKIYKPSNYYVVPSNVEIASEGDDGAIELKSSLIEECTLLSNADSKKLSYTGKYIVKYKNSLKTIYLYVIPKLPNLRIC
jgi:hypothetical protein